jgi:polyribonucleotide nucleotidyltransferase
MAEIGAVYPGKVVNITKFGAFVNILPGRDGLLHISKLGGDRRIDRVEDVLNLGDEVEVRVSDIDNQGKLSLSLVGEGGDDASGTPRSAGGSSERQQGNGEPSASARGGRGRDRDRAPDRERGGGAGRAKEAVSFEQYWESQAKDEFGDLGPADVGRPERSSGRGGGGRGGGGRRRGGRGDSR